MKIFLIILWVMMGLLHLITYLPAVTGAPDRKDQVLVSIILIAGGPFFTLVTILEFVITLILGEDWNGDDSQTPGT